MRVIPAISFLEERPVIVEEDEYRPVTKDGKTSVGINAVLSDLSDFDVVFLVDLDGIERDSLQVEVIRKMTQRREVWADIGARDIEAVTDGYIAGAQRIVLSTKILSSMDVVENAVELSDRMIFCIDYKEGVISRSEEIKGMDVCELIREVSEIGIETFFLNNLSEGPVREDLLYDIFQLDIELYLAGDARERVKEFSDRIEGLILDYREAIRYQKTT